MRRLFPLIAFLLVLPACRTAGTYSERGEHIEIMKDILDDYEAGLWYAYGSAYDDSARVFVNSTAVMTVEAHLAAVQAQRKIFGDVSVENPLFGEVNNTDGDTWVMMWGLWQGRVLESGAWVSVPIHQAAQFQDGRIVQAWVYMNEAPLDAAVEPAAAIPDSLAGLAADSLFSSPAG